MKNKRPALGSAVEKFKASEEKYTKPHPLAPETAKKPDVIATYDGGSLYLFHPQTKEALSWLKENTNNEGWLWLGDSLAVDHRCAGRLVEGLAGEGGFRVSVR